MRQSPIFWPTIPLAVVIDLSAVQFLASAGLTILMATRANLGDTARFAVVAICSARRLIQLVSADVLLSLQEILQDALTAVGATSESPGS